MMNLYVFLCFWIKSTKKVKNGQKFVFTSFHVCAAAESWSKYTTKDIESGRLFVGLNEIPPPPPLT